MIKKINQQTLAEFADTFVAKAEQFKNTKGTKEYLSNLQIRISQLKTFSGVCSFSHNAFPADDWRSSECLPRALSRKEV